MSTSKSVQSAYLANELSKRKRKAINDDSTKTIKSAKLMLDHSSASNNSLKNFPASYMQTAAKPTTNATLSKATIASQDSSDTDSSSSDDSVKGKNAGVFGNEKNLISGKSPSNSISSINKTTSKAHKLIGKKSAVDQQSSDSESSSSDDNIAINTGNPGKSNSVSSKFPASHMQTTAKATTNATLSKATIARQDSSDTDSSSSDECVKRKNTSVFGIEKNLISGKSPSNCISPINKTTSIAQKVIGQKSAVDQDSSDSESSSSDDNVAINTGNSGKSNSVSSKFPASHMQNAVKTPTNVILSKATIASHDSSDTDSSSSDECVKGTKADEKNLISGKSSSTCISSINKLTSKAQKVIGKKSAVDQDSSDSESSSSDENIAMNAGNPGKSNQIHSKYQSSQTAVKEPTNVTLSNATIASQDSSDTDSSSSDDIKGKNAVEIAKEKISGKSPSTSISSINKITSKAQKVIGKKSAVDQASSDSDSSSSDDNFPLNTGNPGKFNSVSSKFPASHIQNAVKAPTNVTLSKATIASHDSSDIDSSSSDDSVKGKTADVFAQKKSIISGKSPSTCISSINKMTSKSEKVIGKKSAVDQDSSDSDSSSSDDNVTINTGNSGKSNLVSSKFPVSHMQNAVKAPTNVTLSKATIASQDSSDTDSSSSDECVKGKNADEKNLISGKSSSTYISSINQMTSKAQKVIGKKSTVDQDSSDSESSSSDDNIAMNAGNPGKSNQIHSKYQSSQTAVKEPTNVTLSNVTIASQDSSDTDSSSSDDIKGKNAVEIAKEKISGKSPSTSISSINKITSKTQKVIGKKSAVDQDSSDSDSSSSDDNFPLNTGNPGNSNLVSSKFPASHVQTAAKATTNATLSKATIAIQDSSDTDSSSSDDIKGKNADKFAKEKISGKSPSTGISSINKTTSKEQKVIGKKPVVKQDSSDSDSSTSDDNVAINTENPGKCNSVSSKFPASLMQTAVKALNNVNLSKATIANLDSDSTSSDDSVNGKSADVFAKEKNLISGKSPSTCISSINKMTSKAQKVIGKKFAIDQDSSDSESSSSDDNIGLIASNHGKSNLISNKIAVSSPLQATTNVSTKVTLAKAITSQDSSDSESSSDEDIVNVKGAEVFANQIAKNQPTNPHMQLKEKTVSNDLLNGKQSGGQPYRRVNTDKNMVDPKFRDNSFHSKAGDFWGEKAHEDFSGVQGKHFRHEKTKKKRGSYKGGPINVAVHSVKFDSSD